jgi:hypothetical protein
MYDFKVGDTVTIKPGLTGAGIKGVIEKIQPWNLDSPHAELRENWHWVAFEDGVKYHFHGSVLERVTHDRSVRG